MHKQIYLFHSTVPCKAIIFAESDVVDKNLWIDKTWFIHFRVGVLLLCWSMVFGIYVPEDADCIFLSRLGFRSSMTINARTC